MGLARPLPNDEGYVVLEPTRWKPRPIHQSRGRLLQWRVESGSNHEIRRDIVKQTVGAHEAGRALRQRRLRTALA